VLASFETATGAVSAALAIQHKLSARLPFRIGVHLGDVLEKPDGSVYGDGVNVSARLQALCEPGSVIISHAVHAAVPSRFRSRFQDAGEHTAKNIANPVHAFRMRVEAGAVSPAAAVYPTGSPKPFMPPGVSPPLVGREADLAALDHLLAQHRHVTVLGAAGRGAVTRSESKKLFTTLKSEIDATSLERLLVEGKELDQEAVCALTLETAPSG
jgi:hypothetical protein